MENKKKLLEPISIIGLLLMFVIGWIVPPVAGIGRMGWLLLFSFIGWLTLVIGGKGMVVAGALGFMALAISGYQPIATLLANGFGNTNTVLSMYAMVFTAAFTESGAGDKIVRFLLSRKALNGKPMAFCFVFILVMWLLGMVAGVISVMLLTISIVFSVADVVGYKRTDPWCRYIIMLSCMIGGMAGTIIPFKGLPLINKGIFDGFLSSIGVSIDLVDIMIIMILMMVLTTIVYTLAIKFVFKINLEPLKTIDVSSLTQGRSLKLDSKQICCTVMMMLGYLYPVFQLFFPKDSGVYAWMGQISQVAFMGFLVGLYALLNVGGSPIRDVEKCFGKDVMWGIPFAMAFVTVAAGALGSADAGISNALLALLGDVISNMPFIVLLLIAILICTFLTQVFSNMATQTIVASLLGPLLASFSLKGYNVGVFVAVCSACPMSGILTAGASGFAAMILGTDAFTEDGGAAWMLKNGTITLLIFDVLMLAVCYAFGAIL